MTTSNSVNFQMSRTDIITDALSIIRVLGNDETLQNVDMVLVNRALNRCVKYFENNGLHLWKKSEGVLFLQPNQSQYTLGAGTTDQGAVASSVNITTMVNAGNTGDTSITLTSVTGLAITNNIGIILSTNTIQWTTITNIVGNVVSLNNSLTNTVNPNANVYTYTTAINKPLDVFAIRRRNSLSTIDTPLIMMAYEDYQNLPTKITSASTPVQWTYNRSINNGTLFVWPMPADQTYYLMLTYAEPIQDLDNSTDTPDFPVEWYDALVYQLAVRISPMYGRLGSEQFAQLKSLADEFLANALAFDNEVSYVKFTPDTLGNNQ